MSSDRAKITYDEKQHYRSVVMQQGRVTLEADWNEQGQIAAEEARKEALNFVGLSGTPDDGYAVTKGGVGAYDLSLSPGTLYVGGMRIGIDESLNYSKQSEWLDYEFDPDWVSVPTGKPTTKEAVYLLLREQEISAVEDSALLEVALGGPDSAARTRLLQRVVRIATTSDNCSTALPDVKGHWNKQGLAFDPATLRLESNAALAVAFVDAAAQSNPCQPQSTGGYLGAENQLIRVKISTVDTTEEKKYKLVWGFDNASSLYRVKEVDSNKKLILNTQPVDSVHQPKKGQAVEILRAAAQLANGEYIAADHGFVTQLITDYQPDEQAVELKVQLPVGYPQDQKPIFIRVWQEEISFMPGTAVKLGGTGLEVTLAANDEGLFHIGDFWVFAVRPGTPTQIYPQRYNNKSPQFPDGPRLWACPLALVDWSVDAASGVLDCRNPFDNLVELTRRKLGGCCTVTIRQEDISETVSLQKIIDRYKNQAFTICLMPGVYFLREPLVLGAEHSKLTLSGCQDGVILQAEKGFEKAFLDGLIVLNQADEVTFRFLRFHLPQAPVSYKNLTQINAALKTSDREGPSLLNLNVSIGVRALHCALLNFEDCLFRYSLPQTENVWGGGIFANSECWGLTVKSCRFLHDEDYLLKTHEATGLWRILSGFVLTPAFQQKKKGTNAHTTTVVLPLLQDACFENNLFSGLTFATFIYSDTGILEFRRNTVRECMAGVFHASLLTLAYAEDFKILTRSLKQGTQPILTEPIEAIILNNYFLLSSAITRSLPLPENFNVDHAVDISLQNTDNKDSHHLEMLYQALNSMLDSIPRKTSVVKADSTTSDEASTTVAPTFDASTISKDHHSNISALKQLALTIVRQREHEIDLSLHFVDNDIDTGWGTLEFSFALVALDTYISSNSSLIMSGNRLQSNSAQIPTAMFLAVKHCSITGNFIQNRKQGPSLSVIPFVSNDKKRALAVTGNILEGPATWPPRGVSSPPLSLQQESILNTWDFLNTLI